VSLTSALSDGLSFGFAFGAAKSASWGVAMTTLAAGEYSELLKLIPKDGTFLATLGIGAVVVSLAIGAFQWFISIRDKAKGVPFAELVKGAVGVTPAIADPAQRARLDDLRRKFDDGVQKFRAAGKDLYSLPWYLLVGPAGSGKTEALRHCNVGFPPGLQDYLQGAGGTLNMHWWFTNHAVVLDTAGRMFMESASPDAEGGGGGEWGEFLKLLKRSRPNQPVNGMFLVIGADSLIRDKSEDIESKAGRIAQQLDTIQRTLDVRFPVFVIITKCDLIAGFREFFDNVTDPNLQHQLLGWSNPDQLDSPLRVELVEEHMKQVKHKLTARRLALVADSTRYAQGTGKRMDEVDELYALPENLEKVVPRLKRYLETIFAGGEWSPKPLFLRGIYFTSSMREGEALDNDLAKALGLTLDSLPGGKVWEKERSFFLRDVFLAKAFREKGLVTRATNVQKQIANRRFAILGSVATAAALVLGFTFYGQRELTRSIEGPRAFWNSIGVALGVIDAPKTDEPAIATQGTQATRGDTAIVRFEAPNWVYSGDRADVQLPDGMVARSKLASLTLQRSNEGVSVPLVFSPAATVAGAGGGFTKEQRAAHAAVLEKTVLKPLVDGARQRLSETTTWDSRATNALAEMIRLETLKLNLAPAGGPRATLVDLKALFNFVMNTKQAPEELRSWQDAIDATYAVGTSGTKLSWPPASLKVGDVAALRSIREGLEKFAASWPERARGDEFALGRLSLLADALSAFRAEETRLQGLRGMPTADGKVAELVQTGAEFESFQAEARTRLEALAAAAGKADELLKSMKLDAAELANGIDATKREALEQISAEYALLIAQLPSLPESDTAATEPAPAGEIRQLIVARRESAEKSLDASASRVNTRLSPLLPMVATGAGGEDVSYRVRYNAYQRGAKDLFERSAAAEGEWYGLADRFRDLDSRVDRTRADIESIARGVSDVSARNATIGVATTLARTARAASATDVLRAFLAKLPESADGVRAAVQSIAESKDLKPLTKPTVAMLGLQGGEIPIAYAPQAAGVVLQGLSRAEQEVSGGGAVVDKALLSVEIKSRGRGLDEYAKAYANAWAVGLVKEMSLADGLSAWTTLGPAMTANAEKLIDRAADLRTLASAATEAIEPLPASVKSLPEVKAAQERLQSTVRALSDEAGLRKRADALKTLAPLGALEWRAARAALLASGSGEAMTDALATLATGPARAISDEALALGVLRSLRDQYETNARDAAKLLASSERWPLSRNADQTKGLDEAALLKAVDAAELLAGGTGVAAGATGEFRDLLLALRGRGILNDEQRSRIDRVRGVASALASGLAQKQPIVVSIVPVWSRRDLEALPALSSLGVASSGDVVEWFEQMEVVPAGGAPLPRVTLRGLDAARAAELVRQLSLKSPGPGVTIRFYRNLGDAAPAGETTLNGPWVAAAVALLPGAKPTALGPSNTATAWIVPLPVVETETKQTYHLWLNVTFSSPMPRPEDWPGSTNWPR